MALRVMFLLLLSHLLKRWENQGLIRHGCGCITLVYVAKFEGIAAPHLIV
jgi:hypothetical protein